MPVAAHQFERSNMCPLDPKVLDKSGFRTGADRASCSVGQVHLPCIEYRNRLTGMSPLPAMQSSALATPLREFLSRPARGADRHVSDGVEWFAAI